MDYASLTLDLVHFGILTGWLSALLYGLRYSRADLEREHLRAAAHQAARERREDEQRDGRIPIS